MTELEVEDPAAFKNFVRVEPAMFWELHNQLGPAIAKQDTFYRKVLHPILRLAITLRFLATGDSYHSLMYGFRVAHNIISCIVLEVCSAIIQDEVIACPKTSQEWSAIANPFSQKWQFHHALGALDGKHVTIQCPKRGGSLYYNYKGFHSIVLLGLVHADYKFICANVWSNGAASDAQIFADSELKEAIEHYVISFPPAYPLPNDDKDTPYFIIGDNAFSLRTLMMMSYGRRGLPVPERIFNYQFSRARRMVENAFGTLSNRFGCLLITHRQTATSGVNRNYPVLHLYFCITWYRYTTRHFKMQPWMLRMIS